MCVFNTLGHNAADMHILWCISGCSLLFTIIVTYQYMVLNCSDFTFKLFPTIVCRFMMQT